MRHSSRRSWSGLNPWRAASRNSGDGSAKIAAVTADDVQRVARRYLNLETVQLVAVGDAGKIRAILGKYGPVTEYDTDGKVTSQ